MDLNFVWLFLKTLIRRNPFSPGLVIKIFWIGMRPNARMTDGKADALWSNFIRHRNDPKTLAYSLAVYTERVIRDGKSTATWGNILLSLPCSLIKIIVHVLFNIAVIPLVIPYVFMYLALRYRSILQAGFNKISSRLVMLGP